MKKSLLALSLLVSSAFADNSISTNLARKAITEKVTRGVIQHLKTYSPTNPHMTLRRLLETFYDQLQQTFKYNIDDKIQKTIEELELELSDARTSYGDFSTALAAVKEEIEHAREIKSLDDDNQSVPNIDKLEERKKLLFKLEGQELALSQLKQKSHADKELFVVQYLKMLDTAYGGRIDRFIHKTNAVAAAAEYPQKNPEYIAIRDYMVSNFLLKFVINVREKLPSEVGEYFKEDFEVLTILNTILDKHLKDVFLNTFRYHPQHVSDTLDFWNIVFDWSTEETRQLSTMDFFARFSNRRADQNFNLTKN